MYQGLRVRICWFRVEGITLGTLLGRCTVYVGYVNFIGTFKKFMRVPLEEEDPTGPTQSGFRWARQLQQHPVWVKVR